MTGIRAKIGVLASAFALLAAGPVYAQDSSVDGYGGPGGQIEDQVGGDNRVGGEDQAGDEGAGEALPVADVTSDGDGGGTLPFTGLDLALLAGAGALLLGLGVAMRRMTRVGGRA
jgi:hypothetical protein